MTLKDIDLTGIKQSKPPLNDFSFKESLKELLLDILTTPVAVSVFNDQGHMVKFFDKKGVTIHKDRMIQTMNRVTPFQIVFKKTILKLF